MVDCMFALVPRDFDTRVSLSTFQVPFPSHSASRPVPRVPSCSGSSRVLFATLTRSIPVCFPFKRDPASFTQSSYFIMSNRCVLSRVSTLVSKRRSSIVREHTYRDSKVMLAVVVKRCCADLAQVFIAPSSDITRRPMIAYIDGQRIWRLANVPITISGCCDHFIGSST